MHYEKFSKNVRLSKQMCLTNNIKLTKDTKPKIKRHDNTNHL